MTAVRDRHFEHWVEKMSSVIVAGGKHDEHQVEKMAMVIVVGV